MAILQLSKSSLRELEAVRPELASVVRRASELSAQEFAVHDGIRTLDEQKRLMAAGASKTLASRHLTGHAVDLVPVVNGKLRWEWPPIHLITEAMRRAGVELDVRLRWGGAWDVELTAVLEPPEDLVEAYVQRRKRAGLGAFVDGPHFELVVSA